MQGEDGEGGSKQCNYQICFEPRQDLKPDGISSLVSPSQVVRVLGRMSRLFLVAFPGRGIALVNLKRQPKIVFWYDQIPRNSEIVSLVIYDDDDDDGGSGHFSSFCRDSWTFYETRLFSPSTTRLTIPLLNVPVGIMPDQPVILRSVGKGLFALFSGNTVCLYDGLKGDLLWKDRRGSGEDERILDIFSGSSSRSNSGDIIHVIKISSDESRLRLMHLL